MRPEEKESTKSMDELVQEMSSFMVRFILIGSVLFWSVIFYLILTHLNFFKSLRATPLSYRILFGSAIVSLGFCLYYFKRKAHLMYGITETGFGIVAAFFGGVNLYNSLTQLQSFFACFTGAYIMVRGLDNIRLASEAKRNKREKA